MCYYISRPRTQLPRFHSSVYLSTHFCISLNYYYPLFPSLCEAVLTEQLCVRVVSPQDSALLSSDIYKPARQSSRSWERQLRLRGMEVSLHFISISCFLSEYSCYFSKVSQVFMKIGGCVLGLLN